MTGKNNRRALGLLTLTLALVVVPMGLSGQEEGDYEVGTALPPLDEGRTLIDVTLEQAIDRALELNLDLQTVRLNPQIQSYSLQSAEAAFSTTVNTTYGFNNASTPSTSQLDGGIQTNTKRQTFNAGLSKTMPWYGGRVTANFNNNRTETNNSFSTLNPSYRSILSFNYTQPLLAGFSTDNERTALETQQIQYDISEIQLASQIALITNRVLVNYWGLRAAIEQIEIRRRDLEQAEELLRQNEIRVQLGSLSDLQVIQAEAQVASAEQGLLNAEIQWRNQELVLKQLLMSGADDPLLNQTLNPTGLPEIVEPVVDIDAAIARALEQRNDIRTTRQQRQISELDLAVTRNNVRPDLNLIGSYSLQGVGGDRFDRGGFGGDPVLIDPGGYYDGISSIANFDTPTWGLTLNFSYAIGNKGAKASRSRAELQIDQADLAIRSQELDIVTQVTAAGLAVSDSFLLLQAAQRSREVSERAAEVEVTRFEVAASTNYEVGLAQNQLTAARLSELRAIFDYVNAIADFELVQYIGG
jgi:outer membrane protein TolC